MGWVVCIGWGSGVGWGGRSGGVWHACEARMRSSLGRRGPGGHVTAAGLMAVADARVLLNVVARAQARFKCPMFDDARMHAPSSHGARPASVGPGGKPSRPRHAFLSGPPPASPVKATARIPPRRSHSSSTPAATSTEVTALISPPVKVRTWQTGACAYGRVQETVWGCEHSARTCL